MRYHKANAKTKVMTQRRCCNIQSSAEVNREKTTLGRKTILALLCQTVGKNPDIWINHFATLDLHSKYIYLKR